MSILTLDHIHMTFDAPALWSEAIDNCKTLAALQAEAEKWKLLANDANACAQKMSKSDFAEFRAGLREERRGRWAGEEHSRKYGEIMLPEIMIVVSGVAARFNVPWGLAFNRMHETGRIEVSDGIARIKRAAS